jgi:hypothetical protein
LEIFSFSSPYSREKEIPLPGYSDENTDFKKRRRIPIIPYYTETAEGRGKRIVIKQTERGEEARKREQRRY